MTIVQSFATTPMSEAILQYNVVIAALSLAYAHRSGYKVKMYTDSRGYKLLSALPYDEINTELDKIEPSRNKSFFAIYKYYALQNEPIRTIHTDFDVLLKAPCLDDIWDDNPDYICQIKEYMSGYFSMYENCRLWLLKNEVKGIDISKPVEYTYNTGIIGFGNEEAKKAYETPMLDGYIKYHRLRRDIPKLDFYLEQAHMYLLSDKYTVKSLIENAICNVTDESQINTLADVIGYCHLQGSDKYKDSFTIKIEDRLKYDFPEYFGYLRKLDLL